MNSVLQYRTSFFFFILLTQRQALKTNFIDSAPIVFQLDKGFLTNQIYCTVCLQCGDSGEGNSTPALTPN